MVDMMAVRVGFAFLAFLLGGLAVYVYHLHLRVNKLLRTIASMTKSLEETHPLLREMLQGMRLVENEIAKPFAPPRKAEDNILN